MASLLASHWDVVVVGSGAAGLMTCLELPRDLHVLLLSKQLNPRSASRWAQGGIAAVTRSDDSMESHIADTIRAGAGLCDRPAVDLLVRQAPACVERLLQLGMAFDRENGSLSTTLEAAHSHRRVLHAQDRTGGALVDALERHVRCRPRLEHHQGVPALQLWVDGGRCVGLQVLEGNQLRWLRCNAVVLASGGGGHLFSHTTNPTQATGDGVVMAWSAGAQIRDLEFVQFHPTALMLPGAPHFLISEAVRGEGARLRDSQGHSPVAHLSGGDLAPRDQVSRALAQTMKEQGVDHLWLDLRPLGQERLEKHFPTILGRCLELGLQPAVSPIPVAPAAHYWMGGVQTDLQAATTMPGLYAVGEVACTGVHGANRLASNSLMECLVFARQLSSLQLQSAMADKGRAIVHRPFPSLNTLSATPKALKEQMEQLRQLCWSVVGVERRGGAIREGLHEVQAQLQLCESDPLWHHANRQPPDVCLEMEGSLASRLLLLHELRQRLVLAQLLMEAALFREESRGGHFRIDMPSSQPFWQRHSLHRKGMPVRTAAVNVGDKSR
ncbi:MAG: L-aspartate oxidase [Cyanobacteriota bacterium]|nr:L-aspartate oxidase [Cyanobacteriota bacterium]